MELIPTAVSGLTLWLKADSLALANGASVSSWLDSSPNGNNANQAVSALQPIFVSNWRNGLPAINMNSVTRRRIDIPSLTLSKNCTVLFIHSGVTGIAANDAFFIEHGINASTNDGFSVFTTGNPLYQIRRDATLVGSGNFSNEIYNRSGGTRPFIYSQIFNNLRPTGRHNGSPIVSDVIYNDFTTDNVTATLHIGQRANATVLSDGLLAELIIYNRALTISELNGVEEYLSNKYKLFTMLDGFSISREGIYQQLNKSNYQPQWTEDNPSFNSINSAIIFEKYGEQLYATGQTTTGGSAGSPRVFPPLDATVTNIPSINADPTLSGINNIVTWFDADSEVFKDVSNTPALDSDLVVRWGNKVNTSFASVGAGSPSYVTNVYQGNSAIYFEGNQSLSIGESQVPTTNDVSIFAAILPVSQTSNYPRLISKRPVVNANYEINIGAVVPNKQISYGNGAGDIVTLYNNAFKIGRPMVISMLDGSNTQEMYVNGVLVSNSAFSSVKTYNGSNLFIGNISGGGQGYQGYIFEIIILNSKANTIDREKVEAYLRDKWDI